MSALAEMLSSFRHRYPRIGYRFYSGNADHIKERMENGTLDMGLLPEPVDISKYEFIRMPVKEEWGVLTREDSPLGGLKSVRPENLAGRPLMISGRELIANELANWFGGGLGWAGYPGALQPALQRGHAGQKRLRRRAVHPAGLLLSGPALHSPLPAP